MTKTKLSTSPYKGARDFYPAEMQVRNYIFETWKKVCKSYGYKEYDGPFLESFDIYAAKTGEEVVNNQLYTFEDRGKRKVAIRPEMTPTLARMVAQRVNSLPQPIRWFSIPNLWRYEKPQRGRLREFFQLNVDIFGIDGPEADMEIISLAINGMKAFGATKDMFEIRIANRRLLDDVLMYLKINDKSAKTVRSIIDKKAKISSGDFTKLLKEEADLSDTQIKELDEFTNKPKPLLEKLATTSKGAQEVLKLLDLALAAGYADFIRYDPQVVRGLDYYTGNIFEMYDLNPKNPRAMFGGGRYDDLVEIFTGQKLSGTGFGWGDVATMLFLESWELLPYFQNETNYLVTLWPQDPKNTFFKASNQAAETLRSQNNNVELWLEPNTAITKQISYANKLGIENVVIIGEQELANNEVTIKNLTTGEQTQTKLS